MTRLEYYENIIKNRAKDVSFRDFLSMIASWVSVSFYKRGDMITVYPDSDRISHLIPREKFEKRIDEMTDYGRDFDPGKGFFENYRRLFLSVPMMALRQFPALENSAYTEMSGWGVKNSYLSVAPCIDVENVFYSFEVKENCNDIFGSVMVWDNSHNIYQSNSVLRSANIFYSRFILNCHDIWWSSNLVGCHDCLFCHDLENAAYHINNVAYEKDAYETEKQKLLRHKDLFQSWYEKKVSKYGNNLVSQNVTGAYTTNSKNVEAGYYSYNISEGKNVILTGSKDGNRNMYNVIMSGAPNLDDCYNVLDSGWGANLYSSDLIAKGSNIYYSYMLQDCSFCLGCIGLKNKSYCILNKQYTREEWEEKACEIFASMEADGTLGEFFPASMNPFYFNDTLAYLIDDSFTKEEVEKEGYLWRDEPIKVDIPEGVEVVASSDLGKFQGFRSTRHPECAPCEVKRSMEVLLGGNEGSRSLDSSGHQNDGVTETEWYIDPEIMKKVIVDEKGNYYRIVKMEYDFLMKHALALPRAHWLDRMKMGFQI